MTFLDHDMVSGLGKGDLPPEQLIALNLIMELYMAGKHALTTSEVSLRELVPYRGEYRPDIEKFYAALQKVPLVEDHELLGFNIQSDLYTFISSPLIEDHPVASGLRQMGLDRTDAHHVMLAHLAGCDVFLTCDRGILHRATKINQRFSIEPMKPTALMDRIEPGWRTTHA